MPSLLDRLRHRVPGKPARLRPGINLALWLAAFALARAATHFGWLAPGELAFSDLWHQLAGPRDVARHTALVVVDEASLAAYSDDPLVFWTPQIAEASARLRQLGVPVVGLDLLFSLSAGQWLEKARGGAGAGDYDAAFKQEIALGHLVLVAASQPGPDGKPSFLLPAADYTLSLPDLDLAGHVGLAELHTDPDGSIRRFEESVPPPPGDTRIPHWTFAGLLAHRAGARLPEPGLVSGQESGQDGELRAIPFLGPPGHVPRISLADLLAPDALSRGDIQALKGRVVIIGADYTGMNDIHPTPYSTDFFGLGSGDMGGPELQANIVEALLSGRTLGPLSTFIESLVQGGVLVLALAWFQFAGLAGAAAALPLLVGGSLAMGYGFFRAGWLFPAASLGLALAVLFLAVLALRYLTEERERVRITGLFGRYVSPQVVDQLVASGEAPRLGGIRREVTVLFADIRNFTTVSERLEAEEVVEMLNHYFSRVCDAIQRHGGTLDKFIGDAVMVQFGAPLPYPDHADRAIRAALEIRDIGQDFAAWVRQRFAGRDLPDFAVGVGLHTGPVVVGNVGSAQRMEYTAIGDTVNVASRIEGMTKQMGAAVLASADTLAAAHLPLRLGVTRDVPLKGKAQSMILTEVLAIETP